ncbi:hypothetical protein STVA_46740 [Allostella vacuolata]|nr:hypothetical protein STVA_46740 [Stella vacuolata]
MAGTSTTDPERRVLILHWDASDYDSLRGFLRLAGDELRAMGFAVDEFLLFQDETLRRLRDLLRSTRYAFALGMSGVGSDISVRQETGRVSLWEAARIPFFNWSCDHVSYLLASHVQRSRYLLQGYVFPDHARFALAHANAKGMAFAAHLGIPDRHLTGLAPKAAAARNGRLLFTKSCGDPGTLEAEWRALPSPKREILFAAAEQLLHANTRDFLPVLQRAAEAQDVFLDGSSRQTIAFLNRLDRYVRIRRTNLVADALRRYPVDIHGKGWEHFRMPAGGAVIHPPIPWPEMMARLPSYLGSVSTHPLVDESVHDRVFTALAAGVVPVSESNEFSRAHMPGLETYAFACSRERVQAAVEALLADPQAAIDRTEQAWRDLMPRFSLRRSMQQIVSFTSMTGGNERLA